MRNIEFRGKRTDNNEWVLGSLISIDDGEQRIATSCLADSDKTLPLTVCAYVVDPATVGQFTGLTDRNGKQIYEGDIVRTKYGRLCYIGWFSSKEYNGFDLTPIVFDGNIDCPPPDKYDLYYSGNLEVVGNVYDNLDLMERTTFRSE